MGQRSSKHRSRLQSQPECTEVIEFESSVSLSKPTEDFYKSNLARSQPDLSKILRENREMEKAQGTDDTVKSQTSELPESLQRVVKIVRNIERNIKEMSNDDIDLYYDSIKDELHNNWRYVYTVKFQDPVINEKKFMIIDDIRKQLMSLNQRALNKTLRRSHDE